MIDAPGPASETDSPRKVDSPPKVDASPAGAGLGSGDVEMGGMDDLLDDGIPGGVVALSSPEERALSLPLLPDEGDAPAHSPALACADVGGGERAAVAGGAGGEREGGGSRLAAPNGVAMFGLRHEQVHPCFFISLNRGPSLLLSREVLLYYCRKRVLHYSR